MRIVYLHQYFTTPDVGGGTRSWEFARRWAAAGHDVHMVTTNRAAGSSRGWDVSSEGGFTIHKTYVPYHNGMAAPDRLRAFFAFATRAARLTRKLRGDVVYATSTPLTIALPAIFGTAGVDTPYVFEVRDLWPDVPIAMGYLNNPLQAGAAKRLEHVAYSRAAHVVTISPGIKDDIVAKGVAEDKISVIPHGCDPDIFQGVDASALVEKYPWSGLGPVVLYAGTLGKANGVTYLLDVARAAREVDPSVQFVLLGEGKELAELQARARELGLLDTNVHFLGKRSKYEVAQWLSVCDIATVLLMGPRIMWKDAGQNKFFDTISAGKPVAVNNDSWQSQVALEAGVGIHLAPSDPGQAADQLVAAIHNREWLDQVAMQCRKLYEGRFNRDLLASQALEILTSVAAE